MIVDRMVTLCVLLAALGFLFVLAPAGTERIETGVLSPDDLPDMLGWTIAALAALQLVNPFARPSAEVPSTRQAATAIGLMLSAAASAWAIPHIGFLPATVCLALLASLAMGERRPFVLLAAAVGLPLLVWAVVTIGLDRGLP